MSQKCWEAHYGVPMTGAILNSINTRLEEKSITFILKNSNSKILIFHEDYLKIVKRVSKNTRYSSLLLPKEK